MPEDFKDINKVDVESVIAEKFGNTIYELKVLTYLIKKNSEAINELSREHFSTYALGLIFSIVKDKVKVNEEILLHESKKRYKDDFDLCKNYIDDVISTDIEDLGPERVKIMIEELKELLYSRKLIGSIKEIVYNLDKFDLKEAMGKISASVISPDQANFVDSGEYVEDFPKRKEEILKKLELLSTGNEMIGIPSGIRKLDQETGGWLPDDFIIIGGQTGSGKSILLAYFAAMAWLLSSKNVVIVSLEMKKHKVQFRIDSMLSHVSHSKFRFGTLSNSDMKHWETTLLEYQKIKENYMEVVYMPRNTMVNDIRDQCYRVQDKRNKPVDMIIVDYLNICNPSIKSRSYSEEHSTQHKIAAELRSVSQDFNGAGVPLITGNQLTDAAKNTEIYDTSHIKYSRGITEEATQIYIISRSEDDELENLMTLNCVKFRELEKTKTIKLRPNLDIMLPSTEINKLGILSLDDI